MKDFVKEAQENFDFWCDKYDKLPTLADPDLVQEIYVVVDKARRELDAFIAKYGAMQ